MPSSTSAPAPQFITEDNPEIGFSQSIIAKPILFKQSKYQKISIHQSPHYGKILVLDDVVQFTESEARSYTEMMTHIPLMEHENPKNVLIIGGGAGYALNEILKHESVEHVDQVEIDEDVISACKEHFPRSNVFHDSRVKLHIMDGAHFAQSAPDNYYDVIIQDSSDPFTYEDDGTKVDLPSGVLYSKAHFREMFRILKQGGVFNFQAQTFNIPTDLDFIRDWRSQVLDIGFSSARYGSLYITSYIGGQIGFLMCQKNGADTSVELEMVQSRFDQIVKNDMETEYYQPCLQSSCFHLPRWVEKRIYGENEVVSSEK